METINTARQLMVDGVSTVAVDTASSAVNINVDYYFAMFENIGMPPSILDYVVSAVGRSYNFV